MRLRVKNMLDKLENMGVIAKQEGPTDWVSALLITTKRSGDLRICIDPRPLNKALKRERFERPTLDDMLPDLGKAKHLVFSTFDCSNGFWHVKLSEKASLLTTFTRYPMAVPEGISEKNDTVNTRVLILIWP